MLAENGVPVLRMIQKSDSCSILSCSKQEHVKAYAYTSVHILTRFKKSTSFVQVLHIFLDLYKLFEVINISLKKMKYHIRSNIRTLVPS